MQQSEVVGNDSGPGSLDFPVLCGDSPDNEDEAENASGFEKKQPPWRPPGTGFYLYQVGDSK